MECIAAAASGEMHTLERQVRTLIREHHRLMSTAEQLSPSAAEAKLSAAAKIRQEIINKAYELREVRNTCRLSLTSSVIHINTSAALPKPFAQTNIVQASSGPEKPMLRSFPVNHNSNATDNNSSFDFVSIVKPTHKVPLPVVTPNVIFHNPAVATTPGLKLGTPPSAVFIIKVPPNQAGPLNIVALQQNGVTNGSNITTPVNGLQMNGVVVKAMALGKNSLPKPTANGDSKALSEPSLLITHKLAVQATKNIEKRPLRVSNEPEQLLPPAFDDQEDLVAQACKQKIWFMGQLSLCTPERYRELSEGRTERRRRKTANPHFSSAAVEERRRQENERKKKKTSLHEGKNKLELKEELEQQAEKLRMEKAELLRKHEQALQRLDEERSRAQMLIDQQRSVEQRLERLRKFMSIVAENRPSLCT